MEFPDSTGQRSVPALWSASSVSLPATSSGFSRTSSASRTHSPRFTHTVHRIGGAKDAYILWHADGGVSMGAITLRAYSNKGADHWSDFRKLYEAPAQGERSVKQRCLIFHFVLFSTSRPTATQVYRRKPETRNSRVFNVSHIATQVYLQHPLRG
jgi:hypothetical protein